MKKAKKVKTKNKIGIIVAFLFLCSLFCSCDEEAVKEDNITEEIIVEETVDYEVIEESNDNGNVKIVEEDEVISDFRRDAATSVVEETVVQESEPVAEEDMIADNNDYTIVEPEPQPEPQ